MKSSFTVIILFIALSLVGCVLVPLLPVKLAPSQTLPALTVSFSMQGNSARAVETEVTSRIESALARVKGVKNIDSRSDNNYGSVSVEFDRHTDMDLVRFEVSTVIRQLWSQFPEAVSYPSISMRQVDDEASRPFMTYTLNAAANPIEIQTYGDDRLKPLLAKIDGIYSVEISGAQPMEWQLTYDVDLLASAGITPDDISRAITEHKGTQFLGIVPTEHGEWMRIVQTSQSDATEFDPSAISVKGMPLDKLVTVLHTEEAARSYFRINGLNSIYVNIRSTEEANQIALAEKVKEAMKEFEKGMPSGYMVNLSYDATESIHEELDKIYFRTGLTVLILLLFVGIISLSWRYVLLITIGLALNMAIAVVFYYFCDVEIQLYSLAGITISLNLVIDNLIVMTDHFTRKRNRRAFTAILAATLTTIGALSVVYFMDEKTRLSLVDFVTVVIINLAVSLAVALFLVPALVDRLGIRSRRRKHRLAARFAIFFTRIYGASIHFMLRWRWAFIVLIVLAFGLPVFLLPDKLEGEGKLKEFYNTTYKEKIRPVSDAVLGGSLRLFVEKVYNGSYWNRDVSEPMLSINATLPNGATLEQMNALIQRMESFLADFPEIRQFQTDVYSARRAGITVYFEKEHQRDGFPYRMKSEIVSKALTMGGGSWSVYGLENDMGFNNDVRETAGNYRIKMTGYNYDELNKWAYIVADTLLNHRRIKEVNISSEFSYWKDDYTEFYLDIDRESVARMGLTASQLFNAIKPTFGRDIECGNVVTDNTVQKITLSSRQGREYDLYALMQTPFKIGKTEVKLADIATLNKRQAPQRIVKRNQEYVLCLQYEYIGSQKGGEKTMKRVLEHFERVLPTGYKAVSEEMNWQRDDDKGKYWLLVLIIAIIFFTTSILFNSLKQPLVIIFTIPVSFIGVFLTFYLFNLNFDQGGFAAMVLLCGITVNAAIYLMNEFNDLSARHEKLSATGALSTDSSLPTDSAIPTPNYSLRTYLKSFQIKIVPIMLTVLSTILGFIPFLVGETREGFWFPLASGIIGGLVFSLVALIIYLPILLLKRPRRPRKVKVPESIVSAEKA